MNEVKIKSANLDLSGHMFLPLQTGDNLPAVLIIHGWQSASNRFNLLALAIAEKGFACLTFDLPGHGESPGDINQLSMQDHLDGVIAAYDFLANTKNVDKSKIICIGSSFGSYLAAILTSKHDIWKLILRVPANYPDKDFNVPQKISSNDQSEVMQWRSKSLSHNGTIALRAIHKFEKDIMIVESEKDEIIPHQTIKNYINAVPDNTKSSYVLMKNSPHSLKGNESLIKEFNDLVINWLSK